MSLSSCLRGSLTAIKIRPSLKRQVLGSVGLPSIRHLGDWQKELILANLSRKKMHWKGSW